MIEGTLNQTATWKRKTGNDGYGQPVFALPTTIKVRWEGKRRLVRDAQGNQVVSEARVYCIDGVSTGDVLTYGGRDWIAIAVSEVPDLNGRVLYREVSL